MSSTTWTPTAVASEAHRAAHTLWRAVEAQHRVATVVLVDSLAEQEQLERLLESSKPRAPAGTQSLHWLLFTPFRYRPSRTGSRFRGLTDSGVLYGADERRGSRWRGELVRRRRPQPP